MAGRPTIYSEELARKICTRLASGESLRSICRDEGMPERESVFRWAFDEKHPFYDQYRLAREMQAETLADELNDIADDGSNDWMERKNRNGEIDIVVDSEHIQRSKLRVDTRKWIASRLLSKVYGDKTQHQHSGSITLEEAVAGSYPEVE